MSGQEGFGGFSFGKGGSGMLFLIILILIIFSGGLFGGQNY